ncbi:MAG: hypothetical protein PWQ77_1504 [Kosmotogales bacterium]|nr:hypothetical protein [Kosmotogales bacterium]
MCFSMHYTPATRHRSSAPFTLNSLCTLDPRPFTLSFPLLPNCFFIGFQLFLRCFTIVHRFYGFYVCFPIVYLLFAVIYFLLSTIFFQLFIYRGGLHMEHGVYPLFLAFSRVIAILLLLRYLQVDL